MNTDMKLKEKLAELESLFTGIFPWYSGMYDPVSGGFYATRSGKEDPAMHPGLEMTGSAIIKIHDYSGVWDKIPPQILARFIEFFTSRYDPTTCYFEEPYMKQLEKNTADRYKARIQLFSRNALNAMGANFDPPVQKNDDGEAVTPVLPEQFESPEKYVQWMEALPWDTNSWNAGDRVQASQNYLRLMPAEKQETLQGGDVRLSGIDPES